MRQVVLYSASKKIVVAYGAGIPYHQMSLPLRYIENSDEFVNMDECRHVEHLPIERWATHDTDILVAFDPILRGLIEHKIHLAALESTAKAMEVYRDTQKELESEIESLQSRTIWDMIKLKLKRKEK